MATLSDNQSQYSFIFNSVNLIHASPADQFPPVTKAAYRGSACKVANTFFSTKTLFLSSRLRNSILLSLFLVQDSYFFFFFLRKEHDYHWKVLAIYHLGIINNPECVLPLCPFLHCSCSHESHILSRKVNISI
jgi:hypothetical protein